MRKSELVGLIMLLVAAVQLFPFLAPQQAVGIQPTTTQAVGTSPSAYGKTIFFSTAEVAVQIDLNGDGDKLDRVIRYYNVTSDTITNTGVVGDFPSVYGNVVVSSMPNGTITIFNTVSSLVTNTGLRGEGAKVWGDLVVFTGYDQKVRIYHISNGLLEDTGAFGSEPSVHDKIVAFSTSEGQVGTDLNGDGVTDPFTSVARFYDINSRTVVNTGALADKVSSYDSIIGFDYAQNAPVRFYNTTSGATTDTQTVGVGPVVYGDFIFLENGTIRTYQLSNGVAEDTRIDGNAVTAYQNLVAFETDENIVNRDLNGDHQIKDIVIRYFTLPFHDVAVTSLAPSGTDLAQPAITLTATVTNPGDSTETFNVTFFWNSTIIGAVSNIALGSKLSTLVSMQWPTSSLLPGSYTLRASSSLIPAESETFNNLFVDGSVVKSAGTNGGVGSSLPRPR